MSDNSGRHINIVIVEDSPTQAQRLERILLEQAYVVRHAADGRIALDMVRQCKPDMVISDVMMPEMDGYELCLKIKSDPDLAETPVILVTSLSDPADVIRGLECRADNFITKPYDAKYLVNRVQYILLNREMNNSDRGDMAMRIFFNGRRYLITADRLQILNLLLSTYDAAIQRNRELTRSREALAAHGTALAQRERELEEANRFLESLITASPSIIFRFNPADDFLVTYVSPNIAGILGYSGDEVVGVPDFWTSTIHPDDREAAREEVTTRLAEVRAQIQQEYRRRTKNGEYRWFLSSIRVDYGDNARPLAILCHSLDITEKKLAETAILEARREAERANRAKSEFLSRMSHELRTPLNAILGFAQLLEADPLTNEQAESVRHILRGGAHLLNLINEILDIARIEAGRLSLSPEPVAIGDVLGQVVELVRPLAAQRHVDIEVQALDSDVPHHVLADRQRFSQVLLNLLSNAVKYNRRSGRVRISVAHPDKDRVRLNITDTGPGIRPAKLQLLFQPFERLGADQTAVEGTGLGLALAKALVEAMGGTIDVESEVDRGSTFWVELPASNAPAASETPADAPSVGTLRPDEAVKGTVLYIEDNVSNWRLVERILERRPGVRLVGVTQGQAGLDHIAAQPPDLILLDLNLPDMPGEDVLRVLSDDPRTRAIPVIVLSADALPERAKRLVASGASAYLAKPIQIQELLRYVDGALEHHRCP